MSVIIGEKGSLYAYSADSIANYINRLERIKTNNRLFFRGLSNIGYDLSPSLDRLIEGKTIKWLAKESQLVEFAEQRFPESFIKNIPALIISNMQHYGIPTRMMDVTGNALVALYFACQDVSVDGKVVVFDGNPLSSFNTFVNIVADTYRLTQNAITPIDEYRYLVCHQPYASTLLYRGWEEDSTNKWIDLLTNPMLVDVGTVNRRQTNQDGKFIIFPNRIKDGHITNELVKLTVDSDLVTAMIRIPKEAKHKILKKLELVGISESFVYPDNVEKVINGIKMSVVNEI